MNGFKKSLQENEAKLERLLNAIKDNKLIPFVGAGMSIPSGKPSWREFLLEMVEFGFRNHHFSKDKRDVIKADIVRENKLEIAAQSLITNFRNEFEIKMGNIFKPLEKKEIKGAITKLVDLPKCSRILTTNFDTILETLTDLPALYVTSEDYMEKARNTGKYILKINGTVNLKNTWVLTEEQYKRIYGRVDFEELIKDIFKNHIVLFLGCSLSQDDRILKIISPLKKQTYTIVAEPPKKGDIIALNNHFKRHNVIPIWLKGSKGKTVEEIYDEQLEPLLQFLIDNAIPESIKKSVDRTKKTNQMKEIPLDQNEEVADIRISPPSTSTFPEQKQFSKSRDYGLSEFLQDLSEKRDFVTKVHEVNVKLAKDVDAGCVRLFLNTKRHQYHVRDAEYNPNGLKSASWLSVEEGLVGWVLENGDISYHPSPKYTPFKDRIVQTDSRVLAEFVAPIKLVDGTTIGALLVDWDKESFSFGTESWEEIPGTIVEKCLKKIEHEVNERYKVEKDLADKCRNEIEFCVKGTNSARGYIALWTSYGVLEYFPYGEGKNKFLELDPTEGICGKVLRTGKIENIEDLSKHAGAVVSDPELMSELVYPIKKDNVVIGIINIERANGRYNEKAERLLESSSKRISEIFDAPLDKVMTTSSTVILNSYGLSENEILNLLKQYAFFMLRKEREKGDVEVRLREPTNEEKESRWQPPNDKTIELRIHGLLFKILELKHSEKTIIFKRTLDQIRLQTQIAVNAIRRNRNLGCYQKIIKMIADADKLMINRIDLLAHLRRIIREVNSLLGGSHTTLFWVSHSNEKLFVPAVSTADVLYTMRESIEGYNKDMEDQGITGHVIRTKKPILIQNLEKNKLLNDVNWVRLISATKYDYKNGFVEKARSYMAWPILDKDTGKLIGLIRSYIEKQNIKPSFTKNDFDMLGAIASTIKSLLKAVLKLKLMPAVKLKPIREIKKPKPIEVISDKGCEADGTPPRKANLDNELLPPQLLGYTYPANEVFEARKNNRLLSLRLETSLVCNLDCIYCCNDSGVARPNELDLKQKLDVIGQAKDLGAKSVVFIGGGEFLCYDNWKSLLRHASYDLGMIPVIFTNGINITQDIAKLLFDENCTVILKVDSLKPLIQEKMAGGRRGYYNEVMETFEYLWNAGYDTEADRKNVRLGASCVVTKMNYDGVPEMWEFCRKNGLFPNIEWLVLNGRARGANELAVSNEKIWDLRERLLEFDRQYGYDWLKYTPRVGSGCLQFMYSLYITYDGFIRPCASIHHKSLNVKDIKLKDVMEMEFFKIARNIDKYLKGKCGKCGNKYNCCGCRGLTHTFMRLRGLSDIDALCWEDPSCPIPNELHI